jgi:hypothetical protein
VLFRSGENRNLNLVKVLTATKLHGVMSVCCVTDYWKRMVAKSEESNFAQPTFLIGVP